MGACQGKWSCLRPSGSEHACFPASPATLTSLLLPDLPFLPLCSEMDIPVPWSFFSQPCHDYSFPPFRSQSLSEIMSPPSFSLPYIVINLFFFFILSAGQLGIDWLIPEMQWIFFSYISQFWFSDLHVPLLFSQNEPVLSLTIIGPSFSTHQDSS